MRARSTGPPIQLITAWLTWTPSRPARAGRRVRPAAPPRPARARRAARARSHPRRRARGGRAVPARDPPRGWMVGGSPPSGRHCRRNSACSAGAAGIDLDRERPVPHHDAAGEGAGRLAPLATPRRLLPGADERSGQGSPSRVHELAQQRLLALPCGRLERRATIRQRTLDGQARFLRRLPRPRPRLLTGPRHDAAGLFLGGVARPPRQHLLLARHAPQQRFHLCLNDAFGDAHGSIPRARRTSRATSGGACRPYASGTIATSGRSPSTATSSSSGGSAPANSADSRIRSASASRARRNTSVAFSGRRDAYFRAREPVARCRRLVADVVDARHVSPGG